MPGRIRRDPAASIAIEGEEMNRHGACRLLPLAPNVFARKGALGELIFIPGKKDGASRIVDYRKFQPLIWTKQ